MIDRHITADEFFSKRPACPVVTVERGSGRILGLNWTNRQAFDKTLATGICHYYDRVNNVIYLKGEHSNEKETIREIRLDCCHARRHELHLLYTVDLAPGKCKFGVKDCHFYIFRDNAFRFDATLITDPEAVETYAKRITCLLDIEADKRHQQRYMKKRQSKA